MPVCPHPRFPPLFSPLPPLPPPIEPIPSLSHLPHCSHGVTSVIARIFWQVMKRERITDKVYIYIYDQRGNIYMIMWIYIYMIYSVCIYIHIYIYMGICIGPVENVNYGPSDTGWRICERCCKVLVSVRNRATNHRALLQNMIYTDKASYAFLPPCIDVTFPFYHICPILTSCVYMIMCISYIWERVCVNIRICIYIYIYLYVYVYIYIHIRICIYM